jgi:hypothetical protein
MWTSKGEPVDTQGRCWLRFDLGRSARVIGLHVWNYNEAGNWHRRSIKSFDLLTSEDGEAWSPAGSFKLRVSAGADDEPGERVDLPRPVKARYLKMVPTAHYGCDHLTGLSEIRVYVSDATAADKVLAPRPPPSSRAIPGRHTPRAASAGPSRAARTSSGRPTRE